MIEKPNEQELKKAQEICDKGDNALADGQADEAMAFFKEAEAIFQSLNDLHWLTYVRYKVFQLLITQEKNAEAISLAEVIMKGYISIKDNRGLILILIGRANLYMDMEQADSALVDLKLAETIIEKSDHQDLAGYLFSRLSHCQMIRHEINDAILYLKKSLTFFPEAQAPHEYYWCVEMLGDCYNEVFDIQKAIRHLQVALNGYDKLNDKEAKIDVLKKLIDMHRNSGNSSKADELVILLQREGIVKR